VSGAGGIILRTTNGGTTWVQQSVGLAGGLLGVCLVDVNHATAVGFDGAILRTTDGGTTWTQQSSGTAQFLFGVSFTDVNIGTVVGDGGTILRTTNGGETWTLQSNVLPYAYSLRSVSFTDANKGTIVGSYGSILRTTDGGTTWKQQSLLTTNTLLSVSFTDSNNGTAVGEYGIILRTTNGGVTFIKEERLDEIPDTYYLSGNFPNPFNPSTKIKYSIPKLSDVEIKIFDILGKEIDILVQEVKPAGTYELTWNAANLSSGVYFYRIKAGDFVQTKKMILLK
jgi:hypothetical protein